MLNEQFRALVVIETMAVHGGDSLFPGCAAYELRNPYESWTREELEAECKKALETFWRIYEYAHVATGTCKNKHLDWVDSLLKTEQQMINDHSIPHPSKEIDTEKLNWPIPKERINSE